MAASDQELLSRAITGDEPSMNELLERQRPAIRRWLSKKIPRQWRALLAEEDVIQQTWADAFFHIRGYVPRPGKSFAAWLHVIAKRNLIEALRMLEADKRGGGRQAVEMTVDPEGSCVQLYEFVARTLNTPSRQLARKEACEAVTKAIERLPETYARAVRMYDLEGEAIETVASALNRTPSAVHMIRLRAIRQLGELLGSDDLY